MIEQSLSESFANEQLPEAHGAKQGINLADYGREEKSDFNTAEGVVIEVTEVLVSSEHLAQPGDQRRPVDYVVYDRNIAGSLPAGEITWAYAQMPDGTIELQDIKTTARADGREQHQAIHREFRDDGSVQNEEVRVDGRLFKRRTYGASTDYDGEIVHDDFFNNDGAVDRRVVYFKKPNQGAWQSFRSTYKDGEDRQDRIEGSLSGPPPLQGIPQLNPLVTTPSLGYMATSKIVTSR